ncbi:MAG: hypothetical protein ACRDR6_03400 [Pseudonocardiaceae bacterium]
MSVPVADRTTAAHAKPLLTVALDGLVPARLLGRPTKGDYTACLYAGLQQAAPHLRELLTDPLLAEVGVPGRSPWRRDHRRTVASCPPPSRPRLWATVPTKDRDVRAAAP